MKKAKWFLKTVCNRARAWRRSKNDELRELDAFRKCVRLERKAVEYPYAVPLLTELMEATARQARKRDEPMSCGGCAILNRGQYLNLCGLNSRAGKSCKTNFEQKD